MYYTYDEKNSIRVPAPFGRTMTPIFMGDDDQITDCSFSVHMTVSYTHLCGSGCRRNR